MASDPQIWHEGENDSSNLITSKLKTKQQRPFIMMSSLGQKFFKQT